MENWIPEICYEEVEDGLTSHIPFIQVPDGEEMPGMLFVFESRDTGEVEPGPEGEEMPAGEEEPVEAETDPSFIVKGRRK